MFNNNVGIYMQCCIKAPDYSYPKYDISQNCSKQGQVKNHAANNGAISSLLQLRVTKTQPQSAPYEHK